MTTDRGRIVDWAERHDAIPVRVDSPKGGTNVRVVIDTDDESAERMAWDQFVARLEEEGLVFQYREPAGDETEGDDRDLCRVVAREEAAERSAEETEPVDDEKAGGTDETKTDKLATSDTGDHEPVVVDRPEGVDADADEETTMSESARGAEEGALVLEEIHEDLGLLDAGLDEEYLVFENDSETPLDLSGWTVENEAGRSYRFPEGVVLEPGEHVTLHSAEGEDTETDLHWGATEPVWDEQGDVVTVTTADGRRLLREPFK